MPTTRIILTGARGRMGQVLSRCAASLPELEIVGHIDVGDDLGTVIERGDVVVDFSLPAATLPIARAESSWRQSEISGVTACVSSHG